LDALAARGLAPGVDVSVVGLCSDEAAQDMAPALSNISVETAQVSSSAMDILFRLMDGDRPDDDRPASPGTVQLVPPRLVKRNTTLR
jgi:DNA-binding LacI/PurR family transcriptional regulator